MSSYFIVAQSVLHRNVSDNAAPIKLSFA